MLLGLAHLLDAAEEIRDPLKFMSFSYENMYGWVPKRYKRHNFNQLVSRSLKSDLIEKVEKNGEIYMRITSGGRKKIQRDFPMLSFQNKPWDGKWRIVMFDIEEVNKSARERLRSKLKELGFGMLQKSVFISPHNIIKDFLEFAEAAGLKDYLYVFETEHFVIGEKSEFANKIWKLDELNNSYKEVIDEITEMKNKDMFSGSDRMNKLYDENKDGLSNLSNFRNKWLKIVVSDPFLPNRLLPKPWWGDKAGRLVRSLAT